MNLRRLTIIGTGLIGGSVARAARSRGVARAVVGLDNDPRRRERAVALGVVDEAAKDRKAACAGAEVVVVCAPVDVIAAEVLAAAPHCPAGALLTDTGGTKLAIVRGVEGRMPAGVHFVGSHPLAGSEKDGPEHAHADLFEGRLTVVTRTSSTDPAALDRCCTFWQALGSRTRVMDPEEHDRALALTSHLPHLIASALAGSLSPELQELTATGFRDATRLAASNPRLWTAIFLDNRAALLEALTHFGTHLDCLRQALEAGDRDAVARLLEHARRVRNDLS